MTKKTASKSTLLERYVADPAGVRAEIATRARKERTKAMREAFAGMRKAIVKAAIALGETYAHQPRSMHQLY